MKANHKQISRRQKKRTGAHQKHNKRFVHTYLPYLPMTIILFLSLLLSGYRPHPPGILAYATSISAADLLLSTNSQRATHGVGTLTLNTQLAQAAQTKANDMTTKNYWSHNTPNGEEPWVFVISAGYSYIKAGENLAYGFTTSADTVNGWMNSPSHKANMLDADYSEVGFGFANSSNFNNAGEETIVVAMYGKPQVLASVPSTVPTAPQSTPAELTAIPEPQAKVPAPTQSLVPPVANSTPSTKDINLNQAQTNQPITNTESNTVVSSAKSVSQIEALTNGKYHWVFFVVAFGSGVAISVLLLRHGFAFKRLLRNGEQFVLHHPLIDSTLLALVILGLTLSRTVGFIL